jgi:serine-type D-Ala-D-Ala carboxypeptidase/endopeptidase (penicillin-binding protein 4)
MTEAPFKARKPRRVWLFAAVGGLLAALTWVGATSAGQASGATAPAVGPPAGAAPAPPVAGPTTPAPTPNVSPATPVAANTGPLRDALAAIVLDPALRTVDIGVQAVNVRTGEELYAFQADRPLHPASTMKLLTTAAALHTLGPSYRFRTVVSYDGELRGSGVLDGNLYVLGGGDPTMVIERLWQLVNDIQLEGVHEISKNVVFDDSFFDDVQAIPGWEKRLDIANGPSYYAPLGALSLNYNSAAVVVGPGEKPGAAARVEQELATGLVEIQSHMVTGAKGSRRWIKLERKVDNLKMRLTLAGTVPLGSAAVHYYRAVADPTAWFTGCFAALCKNAGIRVRGKWLDGKVPPSAKVLVKSESDPLLTILLDVNKWSNNFMAEQVLKTIGAEVAGAPGSTQKGLRVISDYLSSLGIPATDYNIVNGSGLSRSTVIEARHLTAVLRDMYQDPRVGAEYRASLSIGGRDGTLRYRFRGEPEIGRIRGKTGSLEGVHCLAGFVEAQDGQVYAFSFLANDIRGPLSRVKQVQTLFAEALFTGGHPREVSSSVPTTPPGEANPEPP